MLNLLDYHRYIGVIAIAVSKIVITGFFPINWCFTAGVDLFHNFPCGWRR